LAICPKCGREVREDFDYCPFCETPLKPFCPSCKREILPDYLRCPYCGFRLSSGTPAKLLYNKGGRSTVLTIIIGLSFIGGAIDLLQGASLGTYDYALYVYPIPPPVLATDLMLAQVAFGVLLVAAGVVQLILGYGLVYGKAFSRRYLLRLIGLLFVVSLVVFSFDMVISSMDSLATPALSFDAFFVAWSLFLLVVVWRYVKQQEKREFLDSPTVP